MHLQGNLQSVFDALYSLGVIDPVLRMDWKSAWEERVRFSADIDRAVRVANLYSDNQTRLLDELGKFDGETLKYLAMEVAREYADFHSRKDVH